MEFCDTIVGSLDNRGRAEGVTWNVANAHILFLIPSSPPRSSEPVSCAALYRTGEVGERRESDAVIQDRGSGREREQRRGESDAVIQDRGSGREREQRRGESVMLLYRTGGVGERGSRGEERVMLLYRTGGVGERGSRGESVMLYYAFCNISMQVCL